jgi:hypothetical protein
VVEPDLRRQMPDIETALPCLLSGAVFRRSRMAPLMGLGPRWDSAQLALPPKTDLVTIGENVRSPWGPRESLMLVPGAGVEPA